MKLSRVWRTLSPARHAVRNQSRESWCYSIRTWHCTRVGVIEIELQLNTSALAVEFKDNVVGAEERRETVKAKENKKEREKKSAALGESLLDNY